jgi:broad specificity phosphatase PhoE
LVRHGETEWNRDQRIQGHLDVGLSERGREQARRLAPLLADDLPPVVYTSDLRRARDTAVILAGERAEMVPDARFREANLGVFQGLTAAELEATYPEEYRAWRSHSAVHRPPGGESLEDLSRRCSEGLREALRNAGPLVMVVAHGGPIRMMTCDLLGLPVSAYPRLRVENTAVATFLYRPGGFMLAGWNDVSHLRESPVVPGHSGWEER